MKWHFPGQLSMATVPSPAPASQVPGDEDKEYMEKLKQLQKYIEPLSRMIDKVTLACNQKLRVK